MKYGVGSEGCGMVMDVYVLEFDNLVLVVNVLFVFLCLVSISFVSSR